MSVAIGPLQFTYHADSGFTNVEIAGSTPTDPVGTFDMDDETWRAFEAAAQLPPERRNDGAVIVALTPEEAKSIGIASYFGGPDTPHTPLERARQKLRTATTAAGGDVAF